MPRDEDEKALQQIEDLREQIYQACELKGEALTSPKVLALSRRLDDLINSYLAKNLHRRASA